MKILVTVLLTALLVFALATAWVDYVQPNLQQTPSAIAEKTTSITEDAVVRKRVRKPVAELDSDPGLVPVPTDELSPRENASRIAAVPRPLADQLESVKRQEAELIARQENLQLIYEDIRAELATVDELRKRATDDLLASERRGLKSSASQGSAPALSARKGPPLSPATNDDNASRATALMLRRLVDDGKLATAASILKSLKQRDAASVLESLDAVDPRLADRLATIVQSGDTAVRR